MSHNLARLRALLGDELLTRGPEGMRPTPRALALVDPVRITLVQITALVSPNQTFDAAPPNGRSGSDCPTAPRCCSVRHYFPTSARAHRASDYIWRPLTGCLMSSTPAA